MEAGFASAKPASFLYPRPVCQFLIGFAILNLSKNGEGIEEIGATFDRFECISDKFGASATMKKIRNILSSLTIVMLAVVALSFSGRYVAFITTCEGMGTQDISINDRQPCCCSGDEDPEVGTPSEAVSDDGCCKVEVKGIAVDDFSYSIKKISFGSSDYTLVPFALFVAVLSQGYEAPLQYASYTPPDVGPLTGSDIIFTISRQLRI